MRILILSACWLSLGCVAETPRAPVPSPPPTPRPETTVPAPVGLPSDSASIQPQLAADTTAAAVLTPEDSAIHAADTLEKAAILAAGGRVARVGKELRIQLSGGRIARYPAHGDVWNRYLGYHRALRSHVVNMRGMEGSGAYFVVDDSTGDSIKVWGKPVVSPDGTRFALASMEGEAGYDSNLLEVWRVVGRKWENEFSLEPEKWEASNAVWRDSATVDFTKYSWASDSTLSYTKSPGRLRLIDGKWVVTDP